MRVHSTARVAFVMAAATVFIAGTARAQSASDIAVRGIGRNTGCTGPAYQVELVNHNATFYYSVNVGVKYINGHGGPATCSDGTVCLGKIDTSVVLPPCNGNGSCVAVNGTSWPSCCKLPAIACGRPGAWCTTELNIGVLATAYSTDGINWMPLNEWVCDSSNGNLQCPEESVCQGLSHGVCLGPMFCQGGE